MGIISTYHTWVQIETGFLLKSIEYLGHVITKDGIEPVLSNAEAIVKAPTPTNMLQPRVCNI